MDDLPDDCSVTRRFGVHQGTHVVDGVQVPKVRPIDDFTESLINLTNSSSESIEVHGIDAVVSGISLRIRTAKERGVSEHLNIRTMDLRKAYKHLPLSDKALRDSYIVVVDPGDHQPRIFQSLVLPFGARAAVMGFCRTSRAIWQLGVTMLYLHWSVYFDDFILIGDASENAHLNLVVSAFFSLLGWEIADDKGSAFDSCAKALGVIFDLSSCNSGIVYVKNTVERQRELESFIDGILQRGKLQRGELAVLRGRLWFANNQVFGRHTRILFGELTLMSRHPAGSFLDHRMTEVLVQFKRCVCQGPPRSLQCLHRDTFHLFRGVAGLGGVLFSASGDRIACWGTFLTPPQLDAIQAVHSEERKTLIAELEALAIATAFVIHHDVFQHVDILVFSDNEAVRSSLISCRSIDTFLNKVIDFVTRAEIRIWRHGMSVLQVQPISLTDPPEGSLKAWKELTDRVPLLG